MKAATPVMTPESAVIQPNEASSDPHNQFNKQSLEESG